LNFLERNNSKLDLEAQNIISDAKQKARELLLDAKDEANEIIKELNSKNMNVSNANKLRNKLNSSIEEISSIEETSNRNKEVNIPITANNIRTGQAVMVKKLNQKATILSLPNKSGEVQVQIGIMKMNVNISDLQLCVDSNNSNGKALLHTKNANSSISFSTNSKAQTISSEINVIGLNVDQALPIIDKYLDDASISKLSSVRIVHGKGTGKLREGIHSFLRKNSHVDSFRLGTFGEGEMGVTIVTLK
jgi:DNA mismatch repair protein MutS2